MARIIGMMCLLALTAAAPAAGWAQSSAAEPYDIPPGTYTSPDGTEAVIVTGNSELFFSVVITGISSQGERRVEMTLPCRLHPDRAMVCAVSSNSVDALDLVWYRWAYNDGRITRTHPESGGTVAFVKE